MKKYLTAIGLIILLPYIAWLYIKRYKYYIVIYSYFVAVIIWLIFMIKFLNRTDLNIIDISSAYNKGTVRTSTDFIVIHHTAGEGATPAYIAKIHLQERGWSSIGYHYFIAADGTIYNLRTDNESHVPHAWGFNDNCIAICIDGNYSKRECSEDLWNIALELTRKMMDKYNIDSDHVIGHRELPEQKGTECPGLKFDMNKFRKDL